MSSASRILSRLEEQLPEDTAFDKDDVMADERYLRKSAALVTDALQKGYDVMQMPNGDIIVTEIKTVTFQYNWDEKKGKFERAKSGSRVKRGRASSIQKAQSAAPKKVKPVITASAKKESELV